MTLHFHWLHLPRRLARTHGDRAVRLVMSVIAVSLLFSALRIVDAAVSGALVRTRAVAQAPAASDVLVSPEMLIGTDPTGAGAAPEPATLEVPEATADAISL